MGGEQLAGSELQVSLMKLAEADLKMITEVVECGLRPFYGPLRDRADELAAFGYLKLAEGMRRTFEVTPKGREAVEEYRRIPPAERSERGR